MIDFSMYVNPFQSHSFFLFFFSIFNVVCIYFAIKNFYVYNLFDYVFKTKTCAETLKFISMFN